MEVFHLDPEQIFYGLTTTVAVFLAVLTLHGLLSGWWRRYYLLVAVLVLDLALLAPAISTYVSSGNWSSTSAQRLYWTLTLTSQATIYLLVLQLIARASKATSQRNLLRWLSATGVAAAGMSVLFHSDLRPNTFMSAVTRDLTFLSAALNIVLWRFLLRMRKRDMLLLAVSAGIGIRCTGDAIAHSLRMVSRQTGTFGALHEFGNVFMSLSALVTLAIWHLAFSRTKYSAAGTGAPEEGQEGNASAAEAAATNSRPI